MLHYISLKKSPEVWAKYIARMDADDESLPQRLEVEVDFLERHEQVDLVGCNRIIFDEQGEYGIRKVKEYPKRVIIGGSEKSVRLTWKLRSRHKHL